MKLNFLLSMALLGSSQLFAQEKLAQPNIVFIVTDDENYDTIGTFGGKVSTPNIDSLARNGVRFDNMNVVHSTCSPSRYSLLTGRYAKNNYSPEFRSLHQSGTQYTYGNSVWMEDDDMNLPKTLQKNGYNTGLVGKWHLTEHDYLQKVPSWERHPDLETYLMNADPKTDVAVNAKMKANHDWWAERIKKFGFNYVNGVYPANMRESFNSYLNVHNVEWTLDHAKRFIEQNRGKKEPFFLYYATTYSHVPKPEKVVNGKFVHSLDADVQYTGEGYVTDRDLSKVMPPRSSFKNDAPVAATAAWWDASVGELIKSLKDNGLYENTIIVYISDHGQRDGGKASLYDSGVRVPFLIQWPAHIKPNQTYSHVAGSVDVTPTVLELCGIKKDDKYEMNGKSFANVLNTLEPYRDALLLDMGFFAGVKTDNWKYIALRYREVDERKIINGGDFMGFANRNRLPQPYAFNHYQLSARSALNNKNYFMRNQLYNIAQDPAEQTNLYLKDKTEASKMYNLLKRELNTVYPNQPFGEFNSGSKSYTHLKDLVWYPACSEFLKAEDPDAGMNHSNL